MVRQAHDFSCGLAALATILTYDHLDPTDEAFLLTSLREQDQRQGLERSFDDGVSFADLRDLAQRQGYRAAGIAVPTTTLRQLSRPVIAALTVDGRAHFTVLKGFSEDGRAILADPSWGNMRMTPWAWERAFEAGESGSGRVLVVLASDATD